MGIPTLFWLRNIGIGGRLFLAFVLISSITIVASGLATNTYLQLSDRLLLLKYQDIPGLDAAARLNDKSRQIVATAPLLVTSDASISREKTMNELSAAISDMDSLMRNLPDYNRYFLELITQIQNSLTLLNQSVERREVIRSELATQSLLIFPLFQDLIFQVDQLDRSAELEQVISRLYYFSGLIEKVSNDASFNELDYTFLRLEKLGSEIAQYLTLLPQVPLPLRQSLLDLLTMSSRQGELFQLKNEELDLLYQQSFLLENSQQHIQQLAAQINQYTNYTNTSIRGSLEGAIKSINNSIRNILLLSLISLSVACAISWFYVRRNVLQRIIELQRNMRAIASSQLDTKIRIVGHDEVSSMARDLQYFQQTAIEVEKTNQALAAEIEERVAAEAQLKAAQNELVQAGKLAALGQLGVGITHEINQPLTAIASHLHTAGRHMEKDQVDKAQNSLDKIGLLLTKITRITKHLKAFARVAGTELTPVCLDAVVQDAIELMSSQIIDQHCTLDYQTNSASFYVLAEPIRLEQVMVNLISNAVDALSSAPVKQLSIKVYELDDKIMIDVSDTGIGIEESQLEQIFDPFFTQKEVGQGLGLGLSISYNIVQDFGGQIRVSSTPEAGSRFTLELKKAEK
ncbi:two-component system, NtrC family, C4-dicarboxylate transport sensor histidine kinase DctB [Marinomonas polaris DSM 16579]|uniref:C4-dicarboxylate transport sensor protein DctB n=1 Tax=Marinomonas polaris DSM 16579 TaxID=1122206 RepID=A0A1M5F3K3_9GAMM|nr:MULTISPECIES: ATP-binding protein [Marinomonas]SHF85781.1 two-component system, NtrC family, C4-dicarboxylate transport sensor histidine kinase DctB [Marinomonas polaris DSM 16579]|tara:strand:+ start:19041 stop:20933 length:1893 start_codon:yes stop_codon:yes gene_type:complete